MQGGNSLPDHFYECDDYSEGNAPSVTRSIRSHQAPPTYYPKDASFNITIKPEYEHDLRQINVIPQNLSRVFINIINNACYAAHQKKLHLLKPGNDGAPFSPTLSVSTKDLGSHVEIRIRDNGEGIPREAMDKIFEPFFTTKPPGEGTGLGLSICHDIVVPQHQGSISVETEIGNYAEFIITLPKT